MKIFISVLFVVICFLLTPATSVFFAQSPGTFLAYDGNPVLQGNMDRWDSGITFTPRVILFNDTLYLFYTGSENITTLPSAIGFATSTDGYSFAKSNSNPVLEADQVGFDAYALSDPVVFRDGSSWLMYYGAKASTTAGPGDCIGRATATTLKGPWSRLENFVLSVGTSGEWDDGFVVPNAILKVDTGYIMYYSGSNMEWPDGYWQVGMAFSSDGISWTKYNNPATGGDSDPVLAVGPAGMWDAQVAWECCVLKTNNGYEMFYSGWNNTVYGIGYATSTDGIQWTKYELNPIFTKLDDPYVAGNSSAGFEIPAVIVFNSTYFMYYDYGPTIGKIGLATSVIANSMEPINDVQVPKSFLLEQNYPNPFNPVTMINYQLPMNNEVELSIYSLLGQKVATLVSEYQNAGYYNVQWDASGFASGVYFYRIVTDNGFSNTKKLILLK